MHERSDTGVFSIDVDMQGSMCGVILAGRVSENWPRIGVVLASGCQRLSNSDMPDQGLFVSKPYDSW